jgi:ribonuclease BN (tRNA processing enzyme)
MDAADIADAVDKVFHRCLEYTIAPPMPFRRCRQFWVDLLAFGVDYIDMRILVTGVGDAFTRVHFNTGCVIEAPDGLVMLDCPDLVHRVLHEASAKSGWPVDVTQIDDILLTHLHGDHSNGLESFGFFRHYVEPASDRPTPRLHTHPAAAARVWEKLSPAMDGASNPGNTRTLSTFFDLQMIDVDKVNHIAGLDIRLRLTGHPIPTVGLLISDGKSVLGWSGDTPFEQAHIDWLSEADLIVHECNFPPAHTHIDELNRLPDNLRQKTRLVHLPDDFDASRTDMKPLVEGEVLEL